MWLVDSANFDKFHTASAGLEESLRHDMHGGIRASKTGAQNKHGEL